MNKIKDITNLIKTNNYVRILIELVLGISLFKVNSIFAIIFTIVISAEVIFAKIEDTLLIYLFLSFFDEILISNILKGSISRIVMAIIIIKLSIYIIKNRIKPNKYNIGIAIFFIISCIVGIITYKSLSINVLIVMANIFVFLMFSMSINITNSDEMNKFIKKILVTIIFATLGSILYGLCTANFLAEYEGEKISYRFKGTYEPNFMSMFVNLGIVSLLAIKDDIKYKWLTYLGLAIMFNAVIATVSMTGLAILVLILTCYIIIKRKTIINELKDWVVIALLTTLIFGVIKIIPKGNVANNISNLKPESSININDTNDETNDGGLINRLKFLKKKLLEGDWDRISSGRIPLMRNYINESFNRPVGNILFGNDMTVKELYTKYLGGAECSHCSYIDFIYNFGIIGFLVICGYIFIITKNNIFLGKNISDTKYKNLIKYIRVILLIYAATLSLYTKRLILLFFIL